MADARPLTIATAGQAGHGKTALVNALSGGRRAAIPVRVRGAVPRLEPEPIALPSGRRLAVIDLPDQEHTLRAMVARAAGTDLFLMAIDAASGVGEQTQEHAAVLDALALRVGVAALTKADAVDEDRLGDVRAQVEELLPGVPVVAVSARSGLGMDELRSRLDEAAARVSSRVSADGPVRLPVDRAFTVAGGGTVVTGTLWRGAIARGDALRALPAHLPVVVESLEVDDMPVGRVEAGERVALRLSGTGREPGRSVSRGDVLVGAGSESVVTEQIDAALSWATAEARPDHGAPVQVHHGTRQVIAHVHELGGRFFQLRLYEPLVLEGGDRLVIRAQHGSQTLGGGVVLDPRADRHGPSNDLLVRLGRLLRGAPLDEAADVPDAPAGRRGGSAGRMRGSVRAVEEELREAGVEPPTDADLDAEDELETLRGLGRIVPLADGRHLHIDALARVHEAVTELVDRDGGVTVASLREELGVSRTVAEVLLERCDRDGLTEAVDGQRVLRGG